MKQEDIVTMVIENSLTLARLEEGQSNHNEKLDVVMSDLKEFRDDIKSNYVTNKEFKPIRNGFVGFVSAVMLTILGMILNHTLTT